jgi:drug/metabolite transporter (DMT)-like permease
MGMTLALALVAALGWGASDFFGGSASRRHTSVFMVVAVAELIGAAALLPVLTIRATLPPADPRLLLAALAGVAVTLELSMIYRALASGDAFITAPTGALGSAATVVIGLVAGDPLSLIVAVGLACAVTGAGLSAWTGPATGSASAIWHKAGICVGAAAAIAVMLTSLHAAGRLDPYWATAIEHLSTAASAGVVALMSGNGSVRDRLPECRELPTLAIVAVVGVGGDVAYAAAHHGPLSVVSAISSLYPITTIVLGRLLQGHRATRIQLVGIALALGGAALLGATTG